MAIAFNNIPNTLRVPFQYIEFDNSRAQQGLAIKEYKTLVIAQKLSGGSATAEVPVVPQNESDARDLFGSGSLALEIYQRYKQNDAINEVTFIPLDDDGAATKAGATLTFAGTLTADGTFHFYGAGRYIPVALAEGDDGAAQATKVAAAIQADIDCLFEAAVDGVTAEQVNLTANHGGETGNDLDLRFNFQPSQKLPAGMTAPVIVDFSAGATNPDVDLAIAVMPEKQYDTVVFPYTDASNLTKIDAEMEDRWSPLRQLDGRVFCGARGNLSTLTTLGNSQNSKHVSIMYAQGASSPWEFAAAYAGQAAVSLSGDMARPLQTLAMVGLLTPDDTERFTLVERNQLLFDGIATHKVDEAGAVRIERAITTWQTNDAGAPDISYLDVNTPATLSYLRFSTRVRFATRYPRHKLANDGTRFSSGQKVLTPRLAKAELVSLFAEWEEIGLVEGAEQFKLDLIVERNQSDPNRLDVLMPTDLINQLRVLGVSFQFLL